jgi:hypothetical protein
MEGIFLLLARSNVRNIWGEQTILNPANNVTLGILRLDQGTGGNYGIRVENAATNGGTFTSVLLRGHLLLYLCELTMQAVKNSASTPAAGS